ncbi:hypothetical protein P3T76_009686 [Phytophthora citrophthora]|uniref:Uncharacterized protein n=1 Tax=Phytophthora citrophthora TaxID=4793 RepID=A0AAD9GG90_9STRA|nr:hypothetical protein P3T76_009686 [Phytophthora citrophthora]
MQSSAPPDLVEYCVGLLRQFKVDYQNHHSSLPEEGDIVIRFQQDRMPFYPKITGNYIYTTGASYGTKMMFSQIKKCVEWIQTIDVEATQLESLFGDDSHINIDDICSRVSNIDISDDEEVALPNIVNGEAEDVAMVAAIFAMCSDVNSRQDTICATAFSPQLMAMNPDAEKIQWLEELGIIETAEDKIVCALWMTGVDLG